MRKLIGLKLPWTMLEFMDCSLEARELWLKREGVIEFFGYTPEAVSDSLMLKLHALCK